MTRDHPEVHGRAWSTMCAFWFHSDSVECVLEQHLQGKAQDLWDPSCSLSTPAYPHQQD